MEPVGRPSQVTALLAEGPVLSPISWPWYVTRNSSAAPALGPWGEGRVPENLSVKVTLGVPTGPLGTQGKDTNVNRDC